ncbi:hypothetical protein APA_5238 [Pseudanabaena sp. lw0831]|nr:hypothetical protein [Pseudanabaena sp. lw0831]GBO52148.1 hypothetical protein APA_5238 [Pseudanabaena sp. lw0831]
MFLLQCDRSGETQSLEPRRSHCKSTFRTRSNNTDRESSDRETNKL